MEGDPGPAVMGPNASPLSGLTADIDQAYVIPAHPAAEDAITKWHREDKQKKQQQFIMYMNKRRFVVPETGLRSLPSAHKTTQQGLIPLPDAAAPKSSSGLATAVPLSITGQLSHHVPHTLFSARLHACSVSQ